MGCTKKNGYYASRGEFGIKALRDNCFALLYIPFGAMIHVESKDDVYGLGFYTRFSSWMYGMNGDSAPTWLTRDDRFDEDVKPHRKHRTNKAYVVAVCQAKISENIQDCRDSYPYEAYFVTTCTLDDVLVGYSQQNRSFAYVRNTWLTVSDYDIESDTACSTGVHYFPGFESAIDYFIGNSERAQNKSASAKKLLSTVVPKWMNDEIDMFKRSHPEIYDHVDVSEERAIRVGEDDSIDEDAFEKVTKALSDLNDQYVRAQAQVQDRNNRAYTTKYLANPVMITGNLTVNIGCNIYNGIPVDTDDEEMEDDDDQPP